MAVIGDNVLRQWAREKSIIITRGHGPYPVFARGDRRTTPTHWLTRDNVMQLEADGVFTRVPKGLILSKAAISRLIAP